MILNKQNPIGQNKRIAIVNGLQTALRLKLKEPWRKVWDAALPYQDKRDDFGHAVITTEFARQLVAANQNNREINADVIMSAIILHDIGWSQIPRERWQEMFADGIKFKNELPVTFEHERESIKLAEQILKKVNYPSDLIKEILEIIGQHDTGKAVMSANDGLVKDADRLWRFSLLGVTADAARYRRSIEEIIAKLVGQLAKPGFFFSDTAHQLAEDNLAEVKREFNVTV